VVGTAVDKKTGSPMTLLAEDAPDGLRFAGGAFIALCCQMRERFSANLSRLAASRPPLPGLRRREAQWIKPELVVSVRRLPGPGALRHVAVAKQSNDDAKANSPISQRARPDLIRPGRVTA